MVFPCSRIEEAVTAIYGIRVSELLKSRRGEYNEARNVAMYLIRQYIGTMLKDIANRFGVSSYSSVGSVIFRTKGELVRNRKFRQRIAEVEELLT